MREQAESTGSDPLLWVGQVALCERVALLFADLWWKLRVLIYETPLQVLVWLRRKAARGLARCGHTHQGLALAAFLSCSAPPEHWNAIQGTSHLLWYMTASAPATLQRIKCVFSIRGQNVSVYQIFAFKCSGRLLLKSGARRREKTKQEQKLF